jgi:SNF2 family DNA or RNA helicase
MVRRSALHFVWMALDTTLGMNCILGDEMGLGKTLQTLSLLAYVQEQANGTFFVRLDALLSFTRDYA